MQSKIRVEYDFDKKEPFLAISSFWSDNDPDLRDMTLRNFVEEIAQNGVSVVFKDNENLQLRITPSGM